ncbi:MAG: tRNA epoxyqueuosine(34) reductase QueG [Mariprofundaceae bacterium]
MSPGFSNLEPESIRLLARRHGFDLCRFTRPDIPGLHSEALRNWVKAGMHGDMAWMDENSRLNRRINPANMLSAVKSVITVGMLHSPPSYTLIEAEGSKGRGVIATYAHGDDYHEVMKKRLKSFARDLDQMLGEHDQRVYVDTAPVLEHAMAESSGLGWQGKHSLTINRRLGSWMMLGEVFTTAEIEPDAHASDHCGSCSACMDVCPTRAIVAPYVVDARLCISYLTIEHKGYIPHQLRPLIGNRIFGCDDCQIVCPWNKLAQKPSPDLLTPDKENCLPELASLLQLDAEGFRKRFRKSPVKRTGRKGLLRNVCIAAGNSADPSFVPPLLEKLGDTEPLIRGHAAWALGRLCDASNRGAVLAALEAARACETDIETHEDMNVTINKVKDNQI